MDDVYWDWRNRGLPVALAPPHTKCVRNPTEPIPADVKPNGLYSECKPHWAALIADCGGAVVLAMRTGWSVL